MDLEGVKDNFVDIYNIKEDFTVRETIERYQKRELEQITAPTHPLEESQVEKENKS